MRWRPNPLTRPSDGRHEKDGRRRGERAQQDGGTRQILKQAGRSSEQEYPSGVSDTRRWNKRGIRLLRERERGGFLGHTPRDAPSDWFTARPKGAPSHASPKRKREDSRTRFLLLIAGGRPFYLLLSVCAAAGISIQPAPISFYASALDVACRAVPERPVPPSRLLDPSSVPSRAPVDSK
ncbi:hypothetical protein VTN49DRAFT_1967 [Thermomyces lanuginosus]|uniref:uncharacterized protein n=1 Tax=Thermomyces lanuginosus TaxID=5541 RepID=UPI003741F655